MRDTNGHFEMRADKDGIELWNADKGLMTAKFEPSNLERLRMAAALIEDYTGGSNPLPYMIQVLEQSMAWEAVYEAAESKGPEGEPLALWEFELLMGEDYPPYVEALEKIRNG